MALLLNRLYAPLTALGTARLDVVTALVSFERVFEVLDIEPLIAERARRRGGAGRPGRRRASRTSRFAYPSADQVSLASLEEVAVLDDRAGDEVAARRLVPRRARPDSRAGRSVGRRQVDARLARAAALRRPTPAPSAWAGSTSGTCRSRRIRHTVGVVTQDGHLFHDTIRANLRYAAPRAGDAELWDALDQARLGDLVRSLPDGLDTVVGERGYRLSGGERQRLTIARLLLAKPRVVILDEATAHLDSQSEAAVQEALVAALAGRTALVIAHRLSTDPGRRRDPRRRRRPDRRAGHARRAAGRRRPLRRALPHPVQRGRDARLGPDFVARADQNARRKPVLHDRCRQPRCRNSCSSSVPVSSADTTIGALGTLTP